MSLNQATTPVGRVQLSAVYNTEYISRRFREVNVAPSIGQLIINPVPIDEAETYTYEVPIFEPIDPDLVAVVAPNDAAPEATLSSTSAQVTGDKRGLRTFVLDATVNKIRRNTDMAVTKLRQAHVRHWSRAVLDLFSSITNNGGSVPGTNATEMTLAEWDDRTGDFRDQEHDDGPLWSVMSRDANRDLRQNLISSAASLFGTSFGEQAREALADNRSGVFRSFDGYMHYTSPDLPAGDTTGFINALGVGGENAGIHYPEWESMEVEFQRDGSRFGTWIITGNTAGVGIIQQQNLYAYITRPRP